MVGDLLDIIYVGIWDALESFGGSGIAQDFFPYLDLI